MNHQSQVNDDTDTTTKRTNTNITTTAANIGIKRPRTEKKKKKKCNHDDEDAYHMAYQNYRYQSVYFTYCNNIPAPGVESLSTFTPAPVSNKMIYHNSAQQQYELTSLPPTTIIPIPSQEPPPPPGTPLCYYKASYLVKYLDPNGNNNNNKGIEIIPDMIVHQHVNGLCVVCVADLGTILQQQPSQQSLNMETDTDATNTKNIIQFQYQVHVTSSELSLAQKRKRNTKQLQGKKLNTTTTTNNNNIGLVRPSDTLATLMIPVVPSKLLALPPSSSNGNASTTVEGNDDQVTTTTTTAIIRFPCCVLGSIIELNEPSMHQYDDNGNESAAAGHGRSHQMLQLLQSDPYLKGYLAIILPSGPFPPPHHL